MLQSVISVIFIGFVTGALARFALPGPDPMPAWLTVLIGLTGTLVGAGIAFAIAGKDPVWLQTGAFICSVLIVGGYRHFVQKRPLFGRGAYKFPERGIGVEQYRERLQKAGIDPDKIFSPFTQVPARGAAAGATAPATGSAAGDPTENAAHYLRLLEELHDSGVLEDAEYDAARLRFLERLRA
jgi:uncharacterized membrane protein YeaQ/YmgE (transglycosylase-associated protein family)